MMPNGVSSTDFARFPESDWGKTLTRYPVSISDDGTTGDEELSWGAGVDHTGILHLISKRSTREKFGLRDDTDAYIMSSTSFNQFDRFSDGVNTYMVHEPVVARRLPDGSVMYYFAELVIVS